MSRITGLKNKVKKLEIKITDMEDTFTFKCISAKDKEIMELKQKVFCKEEDISILLYQLDRSSIKLKYANEGLVTLNKCVQRLEDKKIKNKLKKLFTSQV